VVVRVGAESREAPPDQPLKAILLMLCAIMLFTSMDGLCKYLAREHDPVVIVWTRYLVMVALLLPLVLRHWPSRPLRSRRLPHQIARGVCVVTAGLMFVASLPHLPLATATATFFVAPLFVTALSIPMLGEQVGLRRWAAVAVGFAGVLVIVRPGGSGFELGALLPMGSAVIWAIGMITTRKMGLADPPFTTVIYTSLVGMIGAAVPAVLLWRPISLADGLLMASCGALSLAAHYLQVRAFGLGPASLLAPFSYVSIVVSTAIGVIWFGTFPDGWTWTGTAIVIASGLYVLHRERVRARERAAKLT
jgi:drug/metabolite transporter (DMT)-like permease